MPASFSNFASSVKAETAFTVLAVAKRLIAAEKTSSSWKSATARFRRRHLRSKPAFKLSAMVARTTVRRSGFPSFAKRLPSM